jgi:23S rRNA (cytosine1962-C5)-methyltransferase
MSGPIPGKLPRVRVRKPAASRVENGGVWVYRDDVHSPGELPPGALVQVDDPQGKFLALAFWARVSKIALRVLTHQQEKIDLDWFRARMQRALARRQQMYPGADAFRWVHGESDQLPGLLVDKYGDGITLQTISEGADARKAEWAEVLADLVNAKTVALRDDGSARDFEGLPREQKLLRGADAKSSYHEGQNLFEVDLLSDHKTGAFLDQRENHLWAQQYARGRGLDTFSYHGGFALSLARGCEKVTAVEMDVGAAERIRHHAKLNGLANVDVTTGDAFEVLRTLERQKAQFDVIVVDPPAFAKRQGGVDGAARAYKELNLRAFRMLKPDGILISCSCSGKMVEEHFLEVVQSAARDAGRMAQLLEKRGAGRDHPVLSSVPETGYLKCHIYRAL